MTLAVQIKTDLPVQGRQATSDPPLPRPVVRARERVDAAVRELGIALDLQQKLLVRLGRDRDGLRPFKPHVRPTGSPVRNQRVQLQGPSHSGASEVAQVPKQAEGEARRIAWVSDGLVVPAQSLADHWGRSRQALDQASRRGEFFNLKIGRNRYYPAGFMALEVDAVRQVCRSLKGDDATAKLIFWTMPHGGLGGLPLATAIARGGLGRAVELASAWSDERGL